MKDRFKRTFNNADTNVAYFLAICMSIFFWYGYFGEPRNTWKSWLSLMMALIVTGMTILLTIQAALEVVFDIPTKKTEQFFIELFNKAMASIFTIIGLLVVVYSASITLSGSATIILSG